MSLAKKVVLHKWPDAICLLEPGRGRTFLIWHRIDTVADPVGRGGNPLSAWNDAAKKIEQRERAFFSASTNIPSKHISSTKRFPGVDIDRIHRKAKRGRTLVAAGRTKGGI